MPYLKSTNDFALMHGEICSGGNKFLGKWARNIVLCLLEPAFIGFSLIKPAVTMDFRFAVAEVLRLYSRAACLWAMVGKTNSMGNHLFMLFVGASIARPL